MQYGFLFDQSRCMGCNACTVACKDWNTVNAGPVSWRKHKGHEVEKDGNYQVFNLVMSCNHCEKPACIDACSTNAISKDDRTGVVSIDRKLCQGLTRCVDACPFGAIGIADDTQEEKKKPSWIISHPAQKCDMCIDRINDGQLPVCVAACPARAIQWGPSDKFSGMPGVEQMNKNDFGYGYKNDTETGPSLWIKKRAPLNIVKKIS